MAGWMEYLISVTFVIGWISSEKKNVVILSTKVDLFFNNSRVPQEKEAQEAQVTNSRL